MAGLTNRKEKYRSSDGRYPFVRLIESVDSPYPAREAFLQQLLAKIASRARAAATVPQWSQPQKARLSIDDFRSRTVYASDGNRIDLAYALYALAHGASEEEVRSAIASRDLSKKGPGQRQRAYVERTIRKACATLAR